MQVIQESSQYLAYKSRENEGSNITDNYLQNFTLPTLIYYCSYKANFYLICPISELGKGGKNEVSVSFQYSEGPFKPKSCVSDKTAYQVTLTVDHLWRLHALLPTGLSAHRYSTGFLVSTLPTWNTDICSALPPPWFTDFGFYPIFFWSQFKVLVIDIITGWVSAFFCLLQHRA